MIYNKKILAIQIHNGKRLPILFQMGLSRTINNFSLIDKLKLLESLDKMMKAQQFLLQSQVSKGSEIADWFTLLKHLFTKCEIPICSAPVM